MTPRVSIRRLSSRAALGSAKQEDKVPYAERAGGAMQCRPVDGVQTVIARQSIVGSKDPVRVQRGSSQQRRSPSDWGSSDREHACEGPPSVDGGAGWRVEGVPPTIFHVAASVEDYANRLK